MKLFKIKDNTRVGKEAFSDVAVLTNRIANKTLEQLEQEGVFVFPESVDDAEDLSRDQMILQGVDGCYRTGNVMGFLGWGNERLVIGSRFGSEEEDYFFEYLLNRVLDMPSNVNLQTDADLDGRLFNYLLFLFPRYLKTAMRKGVFKKYVLNRYNDGHVSGVIDIARHLKLNTPFVGNVAYNQREFSYDNGLMQLVRHTIEYVKRKPYGARLLFQAKSEVRLVIESTPSYELHDRRKVVEANKKQPVRHAFFREYLMLQRLCLLILQHQKHRIGSGTRQIYGILFDGAWLWEEYVNSLIEPFFYHPMNKSREGAQWLFEKTAIKNGVVERSKAGKIYPDFISRDCESRIIADAKYKPMGNIGNPDYFQVLAYMLRFESRIGCFLYPEDGDGLNGLVFELNRGSSFEGNVEARGDIRVLKHGLRVPKGARNFDEFVCQMKVSEQAFRDYLLAR